MTVLPLAVDLLAVPKAVPEVRRSLRAWFAGADTADLTLCVRSVDESGRGLLLVDALALRQPFPEVPTGRSAASGWFP